MQIAEVRRLPMAPIQGVAGDACPDARPHLVGGDVGIGLAERSIRRPVNTLWPNRPPSRTFWSFPPAARTCRTGCSRRVRSASRASSSCARFFRRDYVSQRQPAVAGIKIRKTCLAGIIGRYSSRIVVSEILSNGRLGLPSWGTR